MPEIGTLTRQKPKEISLGLGDDALTLVFDVNAVTPRWEDTMRSASDSLGLPTALASVILSWDVTQDGQPFPPTVENIALLSFEAQRKLLDEITTAAVPSDAEGNASSAPSSTASTSSEPQLQTSRNGLQPSPSPALSTSPSPT